MATSETSMEGDALADSSTPAVSIVIPAYNEATRIAESLQRIDAYLKTVPWNAEVLVVDDGSSDETCSIVHQSELPGLRLIRVGSNQGKGNAVKTGVLAALGKFVLFTDADLSAPIEEIQKLLDAAENQSADVVIGSRAVDRTYIEVHQTRTRELAGIFFNLMVRLWLGLRLSDTQCGFKLFRRERILPVFEKMSIRGFGFDPELLFLASRAHLKILEIPVRWRHVEGSKVRLFRDSTRMFTDLLQIRWNQLRRKYS